MDKNEFLKSQLQLIKNKMTNPSIEWQDIAEFRSKNTGDTEHIDTVRKKFRGIIEYLEAGWDIVPPSSIELGDYSDAVKLQKERIKFQTEKSEYRKWIRELSRDELIAEHIVNAVRELKPIEIPDRKIYGSNHLKKDYLLTISDAHYGIEFEIKDLYGRNINKYNINIFEQRMWDLLQQTIEIINKEDIKELNVFELGDALEGILRANSQLMKLRYGIIDSSILYANFLSEWLNELSKHVKVKFQMVKRSNHNQLRIVGQPKNAFPEEDMSKSMIVLIKERLKNNQNIVIIENPTGMAYAQLAGYTVLGGHFETKDLANSLNSFSRTYQVPLDYIVSGHWHNSFSGDVGINAEYMSVRSIIGVNPYSMEINKTANAGSSMFVFEMGKGKVCEYCFKLN